MIATSDLYVFLGVSCFLAFLRFSNSETSGDRRFWLGMFGGFAGTALYILVKSLMSGS